MLEKVNVSFMIITLCCYSMIIIITHNSDKGENEAKRSFRPTFLNEVVSERSSQQLTSEMTFGHRKSLEESR